MNTYTSHQFAQFEASQPKVICGASHKAMNSSMALQVGKLRTKAAKGRQVHLLCESLVAMLKVEK